MNTEQNKQKTGSALPLIDIDASLRVLKGNTALAKDMLVMLINSLDASATTIGQAYQTSHYESLIEAVHQLHGGCSYCGATRLQHISAELEKQLEKKQYHNIDNQITILLETIAELKTWGDTNDIDKVFNQRVD